jgi:hypothetical protein
LEVHQGIYSNPRYDTWPMHRYLGGREGLIRGNRLGTLRILR